MGKRSKGTMYLQEAEGGSCTAFFHVRKCRRPEIGSPPFRKARRAGVMKVVIAVCACALLAAAIGCSCVSTAERLNRTPVAYREDYIKLHPDCTHAQSVVNGEIVRGMSSHEVLASWGLPNVYVVTRTSPTEQWIYYLRDRDALTMLIYTLTFADDTLQLWGIDQKRFVGQGIVSSEDMKIVVPPPSADDTRRK
jgi:hypothetical protein